MLGYTSVPWLYMWHGIVLLTGESNDVILLSPFPKWTIQIRYTYVIRWTETFSYYA